MSPVGPTLRRAELIGRLAAAPARAAELARAAEGRTAPEGEWSARDILRHLIAVDVEVFGRRLRDLREQDHPRWSWVEPRFDDGPADRPLTVLIETFSDGRRALVATVNELRPADWERSGTHDTLGVLDVAGLLEVAIDHDDEHISAIRRLAAGGVGEHSARLEPAAGV